jgi:hypothetical protein
MMTGYNLLSACTFSVRTFYKSEEVYSNLEIKAFSKTFLYISAFPSVAMLSRRWKNNHATVNHIKITEITIPVYSQLFKTPKNGHKSKRFRRDFYFIF